MKITVFEYTRKTEAQKKVKQMKDKYGYRPNILRIKNPKSTKKFYVVVQPSGLKRVGG